MSCVVCIMYMYTLHRRVFRICTLLTIYNLIRGKINRIHVPPCFSSGPIHKFYLLSNEYYFKIIFQLRNHGSKEHWLGENTRDHNAHETVPLIVITIDAAEVFWQYITVHSTVFCYRSLADFAVCITVATGITKLITLSFAVASSVEFSNSV